MGEDNQPELGPQDSVEGSMESERGLGTFEKNLLLWVTICMVVGIFLSLIIPGIGEAIDS